MNLTTSANVTEHAFAIFDCLGPRMLKSASVHIPAERFGVVVITLTFAWWFYLPIVWRFFYKRAVAICFVLHEQCSEHGPIGVEWEICAHLTSRKGTAVRISPAAMSLFRKAL